MTEFRRQLFKQNKLNRSKVREDEQKENRNQKRSALYDCARNVDDEGDNVIPFVTSTPYNPKINLNLDLNLTAGDGITMRTENEPQQVLSKTDEKITRKKAYLQRFIEYKKQKRQQETKEKAKKPPFITVINPRKNQLKEVNHAPQTLGPPNHQFTAPTGIIDVVFEAKKRDSIYIAIPTPPRKRPEVGARKQKAAHSLPPNHAFAPKVAVVNTAASSENNNAAVNIGAIPKEPNGPSSSAAIGSVSTPTGNTNVAVKKGVIPKEPNGLSLSAASGSVSKSTGNKNVAVNKGAISKEPSGPSSSAASGSVSTSTLNTNVAVNKGAIPKKLNVMNSKAANSLVSTGSTSNSRLAKSAIDAGNKTSVAHKPPSLPKSTTKPATTTNAITSNNADKNNAANKAVGSKTPFLSKSSGKAPTNMPTSTKSTATLKATHKNEPTSKGAIPKKPLQSSLTTGAVSKAKAINQRNLPVVKQPERAKLAVNLKAKSKLNSFPTRNHNLASKKSIMATRKAAAIVTPLELCKTTEMFNFITSTKVKSPHINKNCDKLETPGISPVSPFKQLPTQLATNKPNTYDVENQPRKFNFLRTRTLEITTLETPKDDTVKRTEKLSDGTPKMPTPYFMKALPRRSLCLKDNAQKKFCFIRNVSLNDTTEIFETTIKNQTVDVDVGGASEKPAEEATNNNQADGEATITNQLVDETDAKATITNQILRTPSKDVDTVTAARVETPIETRRLREAVHYFREQLRNVIEHLNALCAKWQAYKEVELELLENSGGNDMIDGAIGQTKLLISKKFMQFNGLIDRCESHVNGVAAVDDGSEKTKVITPNDLEGFWSMLGLQVENVEKRFENLERWKINDWQDPDAPIFRPAVKKTARTKKAATNKVKPRANAGLVQKMREMRAAMRNAAEQIDEPTKTKQLVNYCSPRRLRRSTLDKTETTTRRESLKARNSPREQRFIIVPDRRSRSIAPTVISILSPVGKHSPKLSSPSNGSASKTNECKELLKQAVRMRRSLRKSAEFKTKITITQPSNEEIETAATAEDTACVKRRSPTPTRTPSPINCNPNGYKPILKTPGTARTQPRNVSFSAHCSVQKFRKFGKNLEATEYEEVEQVHIDELKFKFAKESKPDSADDNDGEDTRTYRLRNRKVKLRPSSEFEIPK